MPTAYVASTQSLSGGDFVFAMTYDNSNFEGLTSWGLIPAEGKLYGAMASGMVQTLFPGRPYFVIAAGFANPNGNASYGGSVSTGDIFSIHRTGSMVRFYKNWHTSAVPVPLMEANYSSSESFRFYAELAVGSGTIDIQPEWGSIQYALSRAYKYTASQQVEDFGSTQSSVKVRVYQESALVGIGDYIEGTI